ncbi:MAG: hypothetical protein IIC79_01920 [Chloroflexi bacterium]|nr:hypothetical protein [Chloroflexota bacterium]
MDSGAILVGTTEGALRSEDGGQTWVESSDGLTVKHVRWISADPLEKNKVFLGTEPANLFVSNDGGKSWVEKAEVAALRDQHNWMLPYSPEAGCVRGFALNGERVYAAVEVGGVLLSDDGGESWDLAKGSDGVPSFGTPPAGFVSPDVHDVAVHPSNPALVFAATGGGLYGSRDGGDSWELLYDCYCRAVWLDVNDANHIILGPADYVGAMGRIEVSRDGGKTWKLASDGVDVPWPRTIPERLTQVGEDLFCVLDDGRLLAARLDEMTWEYILEEVEGVNAVVGKILK